MKQENKRAKKLLKKKEIKQVKKLTRKQAKKKKQPKKHKKKIGGGFNLVAVSIFFVFALDCFCSLLLLLAAFMLF